MSRVTQPKRGQARAYKSALSQIGRLNWANTENRIIFENNKITIDRLFDLGDEQWS
jgi:hypothetical protein